MFLLWICDLWFTARGPGLTRPSRSCTGGRGRGSVRSANLRSGGSRSRCEWFATPSEIGRMYAKDGKTHPVTGWTWVSAFWWDPDRARHCLGREGCSGRCTVIWPAAAVPAAIVPPVCAAGARPRCARRRRGRARQRRPAGLRPRRGRRDAAGDLAGRTLHSAPARSVPCVRFSAPRGPPPARAMYGQSTQIAEGAVAEAVRMLCRGGTWEGVARELAWRAVTAGGRELRALEGTAARSPEAKLAAHIDQAVWASERSAPQGWHDTPNPIRPTSRAPSPRPGSMPRRRRCG